MGKINLVRSISTSKQIAPRLDQSLLRSKHKISKKEYLEIVTYTSTSIILFTSSNSPMGSWSSRNFKNTTISSLKTQWRIIRTKNIWGVIVWKVHKNNVRCPTCSLVVFDQSVQTLVSLYISKPNWKNFGTERRETATWLLAVKKNRFVSQPEMTR